MKAQRTGTLPTTLHLLIQISIYVLRPRSHRTPTGPQASFRVLAKAQGPRSVTAQSHTGGEDGSDDGTGGK